MVVIGRLHLVDVLAVDGEGQGRDPGFDIPCVSAMNRSFPVIAILLRQVRVWLSR